MAKWHWKVMCIGLQFLEKWFKSIFSLLYNNYTALFMIMVSDCKFSNHGRITFINSTVMVDSFPYSWRVLKSWDDDIILWTAFTRTVIRTGFTVTLKYNLTLHTILTHPCMGKWPILSPLQCKGSPDQCGGHDQHSRAQWPLICSDICVPSMVGQQVRQVPDYYGDPSILFYCQDHLKLYCGDGR